MKRKPLKDKIHRQLPDGSWEVELSQGRFARVSDEDIARVRAIAWRLHNRGYATAHHPDDPSKNLLMHRFIAGTVDGMETDHINGDRLDNRRENLRDVTRSQNHMNMRRQDRSVSGIVGVRPSHLKWQATIGVHKVGKLSAIFDTKEEAIAQRQAWEKQYFGQFAAKPERLSAKQIPVVYPNKVSSAKA